MNATNKNPSDVGLSPKRVFVMQLLVVAAVATAVISLAFGQWRIPDSTAKQFFTTMISIVFLLVSVVFVVRSFCVIAACTELFGGFREIPWREFSRIQRSAVFRNSATDIFKIQLGFAAFTAAYGSLLGWSHSIPFLLLQFVVVVDQLTRQKLHPPAVLLLGNSTPSLFKLHEDLTNAMGFHRVVNLLNPHAEGAFSRPNQVEDLMRTTADVDWQEAVKSLCKMCPLIVVDARDATEPIKFELDHINTENLGYKVLQVHSGNSTHGIADFVSDTEDRIPPAVGFLTTERRRLPTRDFPIWKLSQEKIKEFEESESPTVFANLIIGFVHCLFGAMPWLAGWWFQSTIGYFGGAGVATLVWLPYWWKSFPSTGLTWLWWVVGVCIICSNVAAMVFAFQV